jgi:flagellar hook protein FlgE
LTAAPVTPGTQGAGPLRQGSLETSNVDLVTEFTSMISAQRAFQASSRSVTTADELLQEIMNLKR